MKKSSPQPLERARLHPMVVSDRVGEATFFANPDPGVAREFFGGIALRCSWR